MIFTRLHTWLGKQTVFASVSATLLMLVLLAARILAFLHAHDERGRLILIPSGKCNTCSHHTSKQLSDIHHTNNADCAGQDETNTSANEQSCDLCDIVLCGNADELVSLKLEVLPCTLEQIFISNVFSPESRFLTRVQDRAPPAIS